jgi:ubiquinone/menaquinone biosynthesis C-methylase UbiE
VIPAEFLKGYKYWTENPCSSRNVNYPFWYYQGKKVLEIGCGTGQDALIFAQNKALYTGIDLTSEAVDRTKFLLMLNDVYGRVEQMKAEELNFPDEYFDHVYSFGVIHHTVEPFAVTDEMFRVLKPEGTFYCMLYNKPSVRYNLDIMCLRRILWLLRYYKFKEVRKDYPRPTKEEWVSINTDTLGCPLSRVYNKKQAHRLFYRFRDVKSFTRRFGWFREVIGRK